jgi:uncharacterized membrane protein YqaE (UPF0057 family)
MLRGKQTGWKANALEAERVILSMANVVRIILSILIPPIGVFFKVGFGMHFWINIVLTMLGYVPGLFHAIWVIATKDE